MAISCWIPFRIRNVSGKYVDKLKTHILCLVNVWQYLAEFHLEKETFQAKVVHKLKTHILCPVNISRKSRRLWDYVKKTVVESDRPQMKIQYRTRALHAG